MQTIPQTPPRIIPPQTNFVPVSTAEQWWIQQARLKPDMFIYYMTGLAPAKHHKIWLENIFNFNEEDKKYRLQIIAPRESAKTTIMVYSLVWFIARFPWTSNAIVSVASEQSKKRMGMIRDIIEHDPSFHNVFGWIKIDKRQTNNITQFSVYAEALFDPITGEVSKIPYNIWRSILKRLGSLKDPTLIASSLRGNAVIGARYSGIVILDDIVDKNFLRDQLQEQVYDFIITTLVPCLKETAKLVNIMTRWMINDVAERLKNNPAWYTIEIQAIYQGDDGKEYSYWPEYWTMKRLLDKRDEMGDDFEVMYMNNPQALTSNKFNSIMLREKSLPEDLPPFDNVIIGTDFAIKTDASSDFSAFSAIGIAKDGDVYVLDYLRIKTTPDVVLQQLAFFANTVMQRYGRLDNVIIENVAFQSIMKFNIMDKYPYIPAIDFKPMGGKDHRMDLFARRVNDGEVFFNTESAFHAELVRECVNYPLYAHDDISDSITIVLQYIMQKLVIAKLTMVKSPFLI